jgi:hypothetical protein
LIRHYDEATAPDFSKALPFALWCIAGHFEGATLSGDKIARRATDNSNKSNIDEAMDLEGLGRRREIGGYFSKPDPCTREHINPVEDEGPQWSIACNVF